MMVKMAGSRRLKRVSWAPDVSLCKIRLFLPEEAPYQSGLLGPQDQLQPKGSASFLLHVSTGPASDDSALPPGFESSAQNTQKQYKTDVSQIPVIKWRPPVKIVLNPEWYVVSGEESEEMSKQNNRNFGVLEAIYPRQSTVPPNPSLSTEAQNSSYNDEFTPTIPLTAIEEDDLSDPSDPLPQSEPPKTSSSQTPPPNSSSGTTNNGGPVYGGPGAQADVARFLAGLGAQQQPDVTAAVSAAVTALMRSTEQGSLIDQNLLIKILSDPSLVQKLVSEHQNPNPNSRAMSVSARTLSLNPPPSQVNGRSFSYIRNPNPNASPNPNFRPFQQPVSASVPPPAPPPPLPPYTIPSFNPNPNSRPPPPPLRPPSFSVLRPNMAPAPLATQPPPNMATPMATQPQHSMATPLATQPQHSMATPMATQPPRANMAATQMATQQLPPQMNQGRDRNYYMNLIQQHGGEYVINNNNNNANIQKSGKIQKPCVYFNTVKGCRHGATCMFLHETNNNSVNSVGELVDERSKKRVKVDSSEWYL